MDPTNVTPPPAVIEKLRLRYRTFAEREAHGVSPLYEQIGHRIAGSDDVLRFLSTLPRPKQQPNLLLAAVKFLFGTARDAAEFERWVLDHSAAIRAQMLARTTQTNEPARCATILPVLARLPGPLALVEVGAAAGLCLFPDRYGYDYGRLQIPGVPGAPVFPCRANEAAPLPERVPEVVWRGGLDLHPVDLSGPDAVKWLEALVWPGAEGRTERLRAAIRLARESRPGILAGDLAKDLPELLATVPGTGTRVVFHSAVLAYLGPEERTAFSRQVREMPVVWVSNEAPGVLPEIDARVNGEIPGGCFILSVNGDPVAFTGPHGQFIDWLDSVPAEWA